MKGKKMHPLRIKVKDKLGYSIKVESGGGIGSTRLSWLFWCLMGKILLVNLL